MKSKHCNFCGRAENDVPMLIQGIDGFICTDCIEHANDIIQTLKNENNAKKTSKTTKQKLLKPQQIFEFLNNYVIGQVEAKKTLAVAVYNHYKRVFKTSKLKDDIEIEKSNIIMVGETGTGKTLLARTIAKMLDVPFTIVDATVFTEAGYVGEDVESILSRLLQAADYDVKRTEMGIVFIDEIDKIARKNDNPSITRDVSGEGVQQGLLKLLEGAKVNVPPQGGRKHPEQKFVEVDTQNILFICGGAFDGIEKKISQRLNTRMVGFNASKENDKINRKDLLQYIAPQDLKAYGLIPELIGRLPVLTYLQPLDRNILRKILTEPKNALIKQYIHLLSIDEIELAFTDDALEYIVDKAVEYKLGARGLRSICEAVMRDAMYDAPSSKIKFLSIDKNYCEDKLTSGILNKLKSAL